MINQTNRQREDQVQHYNKLLDEARRTHKHVEDQITKIHYECRLDIDNERVKQTSIRECLNNGSDQQEEQVKWDESKLKEHCFASRRDEYIQRLNDQLQKCKRNEETLQVQIKNVV